MGIPATLPQVTGQHRNRALAAARQGPRRRTTNRGVDVPGGSPTSSATPCTTSSAPLSEPAPPRLWRTCSTLTAHAWTPSSRPLWAEAMEGDLPAVAAIVRIIQARSRLYGLTGKAPMPRPTRKRPDMTDSTQETFSG
jgi:hypothetical protein